MDDPDIDDDEVAEELAAVTARLRAGRIELRRKVRDLLAAQRTAEQRQAVRDRSARLVRRSELIMRRIALRLLVH